MSRAEFYGWKSHPGYLSVVIYNSGNEPSNHAGTSGAHFILNKFFEVIKFKWKLAQIKPKNKTV